ncbi:FhaA domain-containing protein [Pseudolysinimonas sp.]|uniref:FhaA domain-containing protein n=1 Tax=Pseudolysinimonas sp. TaxID=2680009 RepID=UPI003F80B323
MGILDSFERGLERVVNGAFAKTFKSGLQPLEVTAALRRELDTKAAVVARDRILVPNDFTVRLSPEDHARMTGLGPALIDEFTQLVQRHAVAQRYAFAGGISIVLQRDESVGTGTLRIDSQTAKGEISWNPVLDIAGKRFPLRKGRTVIGRGSDADVTIDDTGASRHHAQVLWDGARGEIDDLGSTNGTVLNGQRITKAPLPADSVIEIGRTRIVFRVLPQSASSDGLAPARHEGGR